ncbi:unnamed protein product, partial [Tuber aestivum]
FIILVIVLWIWKKLSIFISRLLVLLGSYEKCIAFPGIESIGVSGRPSIWFQQRTPENTRGVVNALHLGIQAKDNATVDAFYKAAMYPQEAHATGHPDLALNIPRPTTPLLCSTLMEITSRPCIWMPITKLSCELRRRLLARGVARACPPRHKPRLPVLGYARLCRLSSCKEWGGVKYEI